MRQAFYLRGNDFYFSSLNAKAEHTENTMLDDLLHGWRVFLSFRWIVIIVGAFSFIVMCWLLLRMF